jgi:hypothetical protein
VPELKKLGRMMEMDLFLRGKVVLAKVSPAASLLPRRGRGGWAGVCAPAAQDGPHSRCGRAGACCAAQVNADAHHELRDRFDVQGYPAIKFFPRGAKAEKAAAVP